VQSPYGSRTRSDQVPARKQASRREVAERPQQSATMSRLALLTASPSLSPPPADHKAATLSAMARTTPMGAPSGERTESVVALLPTELRTDERCRSAEAVTGRVAPRAAALRRPGAVRAPGRSSSARDEQRHDSAPRRLRLPRVALWRAADARQILLVTWIRKTVCWALRGGQPGLSEGGGGMSQPKPAAPGAAVNLVANCTEDAVHG